MKTLLTFLLALISISGFSQQPIAQNDVDINTIIYTNLNHQITAATLNPLMHQLNKSYWGIFGNSGTTAGTNFIGTTDNINLIFKRNNHIAFYLGLSGSSNITYFGDSVEFAKSIIVNDTARINAPLKFSVSGYGASKVFTSDSKGIASWKRKADSTDVYHPYVAYSFTATQTYTVQPGTAKVVNTNSVACTCTVTLDVSQMSPHDQQEFTFQTFGDIDAVSITGANFIDGLFAGGSGMIGAASAQAGFAFVTWGYFGAPLYVWVRKNGE